MQGAKVIDILNKIENESQFYFLFNQKMVDVERPISLEVKNESIDKILSRIFENTNVSYVIKDRQIVLTTAILGTNPAEQQKTVSGKVTDSSGGSLPGVSVVVKGSTTGTITDADGKYSLSKVPENTTLQFSFVGMKSQEIAVGNKTIINVTLAEETIGIDEVVAIGYGTMKKSDLTGSIASVKSENITDLPSNNITQALQGRIAGVQIQQNSGAPGANMQVRIRGTNSIQGSNEPLWIIDGFPGNQNMLNPSDIESLEVLKDASSTAIYGSRGANGGCNYHYQTGKSRNY